MSDESCRGARGGRDRDSAAGKATRCLRNHIGEARGGLWWGGGRDRDSTATRDGIRTQPLGAAPRHARREWAGGRRAGGPGLRLPRSTYEGRATRGRAARAPAGPPARPAPFCACILPPDIRAGQGKRWAREHSAKRTQRGYDAVPSTSAGSAFHIRGRSKDSRERRGGRGRGGRGRGRGGRVSIPQKEPNVDMTPFPAPVLNQLFHIRGHRRRGELERCAQARSCGAGVVASVMHSFAGNALLASRTHRVCKEAGKGDGRDGRDGGARNAMAAPPGGVAAAGAAAGGRSDPSLSPNATNGREE